jgi:MOSC domain-containing protein YiiM
MNSELLELLQSLKTLPTPPHGTGRVEGLVLRPKRGEREEVQQIELTPEGGILGDRWGKRNHSTTHRQVSAIRKDVLDMLSGDAWAALSGDNLHVQLDLSEEALPIGSLLHIGSAILRVSPEVYGPCHLFSGRFGQNAHDATLDPAWLSARGRGVLLEVVQGGMIRIGDTIRVEAQ